MNDQKQPHGFAAMDPDAQRELASKGGRRAHELGKAPKFTSERAKEAGRKGGAVVSQDREHMSRIGKAGAMKRTANARAAKEGAPQ